MSCNWKKFEPLCHYPFKKLVFCYYLSFTWNGLDLLFYSNPFNYLKMYANCTSLNKPSKQHISKMECNIKDRNYSNHFKYLNMYANCSSLNKPSRQYFSEMECNIEDRNISVIDNMLTHIKLKLKPPFYAKGKD